MNNVMIFFPPRSFIQLEVSQDELWTTYSIEMMLGDILIPLLILSSLLIQESH